MKYYDHHKTGSAQTLVFIHGAMLNRSMWLPQIDALKETFDLLAIDLPGHGALRHQAFTLPKAVLQVAEVISTETTGKVITVGLSLGGYVAIAHAAKYPEQVKGLVVSGSAVPLFGWLGFFLKLNSLFLKLINAKLFNYLQAKILKRSLSDIFVDAIVKGGLSAKGGGESISELIGVNFHSLLKQYPGPVLIINGENDKINRRYETKLASAARKGSIERIPKSGHLCNLENPDAFSKAIQTFANKC